MVLRIPALFHEFAAERLVLPVKDGGGLLVVFALFPLANDAFFFDHALEALDCLFEVFGIVYDDVCHVKNHLPSVRPSVFCQNSK